MHCIEGNTASTGEKKPKTNQQTQTTKGLHDMLPVLEWVFVPVKQGQEG